MGWALFLVVLAIGGVILLVDELNPPPNDCERSELGCALMKELHKEGKIDGFEAHDPAEGKLATWEINDDDSLLVHLSRHGVEVQYDSVDEELADMLLHEGERYEPPTSELP